MDPEKTTPAIPEADVPNADRRSFLDRCGRFAAVTPPAIALLLSTSLTSNAIASSGGSTRGRGGGHGRGGGVGGGRGSGLALGHGKK
jgi:hypothetical protein